MEDVFLGLGGNIGDPLITLMRACQMIQGIPGITNFEVSNYYQTTPVSDIPQANYVNAVCKFSTTLTPEVLFAELQKIEQFLGKIPKQKNAPRAIDIDILFFGEHWIDSNELRVPHPHWQERLFVLKPLSDLVSHLKVSLSSSVIEEVDIEKIISSFKNNNNHRVVLIPDNK